MHAPVHYSISLAILMIYGIKVCPFLETLTPLELGTPIAIALIIQWIIRRPIKRRLVHSAPFQIQVKRAFFVDFGLFVTSGLTVALFNTAYYQFPIESGLKVLVGFSVVGFFTAIDLALALERRLAQHFNAKGLILTANKRYFPVSRKLGVFATITALIVALVFFLVVNKDLHWLLDVNQTVSFHDAQRSIIKEFLFVAVISIGYVLNVVHSYAKNLQLFFDTQTSVLERTNRGDLNGQVPVSTNDEFGIMAFHTNQMVNAIRERTKEVQRTQDVTILSLASLAETRDNETGAHILRTQRYVKVLATKLAEHPRYHDKLDPGTINLLYKSAPLHDIGKVGIPDAILLKPGKLTNEEFTTMKTHAQLGSEALQVAEGELGGSSFLRYAQEIAETHHEKWDGSGYPKGLKGIEIPISGRLMALADVYDALISKRVYKAAFSHEKAKEIILEGRGSHFDPDITDAFIAIEDEFIQIAAELSDAAYNEKSREPTMPPSVSGPLNAS